MTEKIILWKELFMADIELKRTKKEWVTLSIKIPYPKDNDFDPFIDISVGSPNVANRFHFYVNRDIGYKQTLKTIMLIKSYFIVKNPDKNSDKAIRSELKKAWSMYKFLMLNR